VSRVLAPEQEQEPAQEPERATERAQAHRWPDCRPHRYSTLTNPSTPRESPLRKRMRLGENVFVS
jgi:hypothetical protein